jgi:hypothetical protein
MHRFEVRLKMISNVLVFFMSVRLNDWTDFIQTLSSRFGFGLFQFSRRSIRKAVSGLLLSVVLVPSRILIFPVLLF